MHDRARLLTPAVALALTVMSLLGPPRAAANQVLAVESEGFRADAGHGLIIWSSYDRGIHRYRLKMYRDGRAATLPVPPSPSIFDASVGTDVHHRPAIVYARCDQPGHTAVFDDPSYVVPSACDIHELDPSTGADRAVPGASDPTVSETNPTIFRGSVAFARQQPSHCTAFGAIPGLPRLALVRPHRQLQMLASGPTSRDASGGRALCARLDSTRLTSSGLLVLWTWPCAPGITGCTYHNDLLLIGVHHRRVLLVAGSAEGGPSDLVGPPVLRGTNVYLASATIGYGSSFIRASLHPHSDPDIPGPFAADVPGVVLPDPLPFG